jgi:hypothetical protein
MATETTDRVDLLAVARDLADQLSLPPIGSEDPVYYLTPPGPHGRTWLADRPGLAEALVMVLAEHLSALPVRPKVLYLTGSYASYEPGTGGHRCGFADWYGRDDLLGRAMRLNDRLLAAPGMSA